MAGNRRIAGRVKSLRTGKDRMRSLDMRRRARQSVRLFSPASYAASTDEDDKDARRTAGFAYPAGLSQILERWCVWPNDERCRSG
jgi:hypothetical protein